MINVNGNGVTKFVNLCPHEINLIGNGGTIVTFAESGQVARVETKRTNVQQRVQVAPGIFLDLPIQEITQQEVTNLPEPEEGTIYLVSAYVAQWFRGKRSDLLSPAADSTAVRDGEGKLTGVRQFHNYL